MISCGYTKHGEAAEGCRGVFISVSPSMTAPPAVPGEEARIANKEKVGNKE